MITLAYILTYFFALSEGKDDAQRISNGENIDHAGEWTQRAGAVIIVCMTLYIIGPEESVFNLLLTLIGCAMLFAFVHRFILNRARGLDPTYISPSNFYDSFFLQLADQNVHRGGMMAYTLEAIVAISFWMLT